MLLGSLTTTSGQITEGTGCGVWPGDNPCPCAVNDILMKNCGTYNILYLKPTKQGDHCDGYCMRKYCQNY